MTEREGSLTDRKIPVWFNQEIQDRANDEDWSERYGCDNWREEEQPPESMVNFVHDYCPPGSVVLDQGCGNGRVTLLMAENGAEVYGYDRSKVAIDRAEQRLAEKGLIANLSSHDFYNTEFANESFDAAISSQTMQLPGCWSRINDAFFELIRSLKSGGALYLRARSINSPDRPNREHFEDNYGNDVITNKGTNIRNPNGQFRHNYSKEEIECLSHKYNMEIVGNISEEWNEPAETTDGRRRGRGTFQWVAIMRKKEVKEP